MLSQAKNGKVYMTNKKMILYSLIDEDEAFTQIVEYFKFCEVEISHSEIKRL